MAKITSLQVVTKLRNGLKKKALIQVIYNGLKPTVKSVQGAEIPSIRTKDASIWCANVVGNSAGSVLVNGLNIMVKTHMLATSMRPLRKLIKIYKASKKA